MNSIHQQVAELQQKIDYLIAQMNLLTEQGQSSQTPTINTPVRGKRTGIAEANRASSPPKSIGLNRFRALQEKA